MPFNTGFAQEGATPTRQPLLQPPKLAPRRTVPAFQGKLHEPKAVLELTPLISAPGDTAAVAPSSTDPAPQEESNNLETSTGAGQSFCRVSSSGCGFPITPQSASPACSLSQPLYP